MANRFYSLRKNLWPGVVTPGSEWNYLLRSLQFYSIFSCCCLFVALLEPPIKHHSLETGHDIELNLHFTLTEIFLDDEKKMSLFSFFFSWLKKQLQCRRCIISVIISLLDDEILRNWRCFSPGKAASWWRWLPLPWMNQLDGVCVSEWLLSRVSCATWHWMHL